MTVSYRKPDFAGTNLRWGKTDAVYGGGDVLAQDYGGDLLMAFGADPSFHFAAMRMGGLGIFTARQKWVLKLFLFGNLAIAMGCWIGQRQQIFPFSLKFRFMQVRTACAKLPSDSYSKRDFRSGSTQHHGSALRHRALGQLTCVRRVVSRSANLRRLSSVMRTASSRTDPLFDE